MTKRLMIATGCGMFGLSVLLAPIASAGDRDIPVPAPIGASVDGPDGRTTANSEPKKRSCPENYDEYGITVRVADAVYKRVYQCVPRA